jgi:hypothetical protein
MRLRFLLFLIVLGCINAKNTSVTSDYESEILEDENSRAASSKLRSIKTTTAAASDDYYDDDEDYANQAQSTDEETGGDKSSSSLHNQHPPYKCPAYCKCIFNPQNPHKTTSGKNTVNSDYYDETSSNHYEYKHKAKKQKRLVVTQTLKSNNETEYDYEEDESTNGSAETTIRQKYDITVDCSKQSLTSISNLFDYDFPLEQIVNL